MKFEISTWGTDWRCTARGDTGAVAEILWSRKTGVIAHIWTRPDRRRQGLATAVFQYATANGEIPPVHSSDLTESGRAWVASLKETA